MARRWTNEQSVGSVCINEVMDNLNTYFEKGLSYADYRQLIATRLKQKRSTAPADSDNEYLIRYSRRNQRLMKKLEGSIELPSDLRDLLHDWQKPMRWLVLTEGWCPDAGNLLPYVEAIVSEVPAIETRYVLRDEHPELMDRYTTRGARAIPKLVAFESETGEVLFTWGPRPEPAQAIIIAAKAHNTEKSVTSERINNWYEADRGQTLLEEFRELLTRMQLIFSGK